MSSGPRLALAVSALLLGACRVPSATAPPTAPPPAPSATQAAVVPSEPEPVLLLRGASVMTAAGPTLERADVLVRGSRIERVAEAIEPPAGARTIDLTGRWITPGLIDPHSHIGVYPLPNVSAHADGNESSSPFTPAVRAQDSFWPQDPTLRRAVAGGVTMLHVLPGSANLVGGQGVTLRLGRALSAEAMRVPEAPASMKMACGENPKRVHGGDGRGAPLTRMGEVAMLRQELEKARAYAAAPEPEATSTTDGEGEDVPSSPPGEEKERDFGKEALAAVLRGEILIQMHCYRADEMLLRLALLEEFETRPRAFHHAVEAYKLREALAEAGVGAVVWTDWWGNKMELFDTVPANAALLDAAGVRIALHSDSPRDVQRLNQEAAKALAAGLRAGVPVSRDRAIRWITANPAWILGVEEHVGTLEAGKDADLVVWSGDPFSVYSRADLVFIQGRLVHDRASPALYPASDFELGLEPQP